MIRHRSESHLNYRGLPIYCSPGVHEAVTLVIAKYLQKGAQIADIGCGSGALALRLEDAGYVVSGFDLEPPTTTGIIDVRKLDLCDVNACADFHADFDAILAVELLEHLPDLARGIAHIVSMARPGGYVLVTTPNVLHPVSRVRYLLTGEPSLFGVHAYYDTGHRNILPEWLLRLLLKEQGLDHVLTFYCGDASPSERGYLMAKAVTLLNRFKRSNSWYGDGKIVGVLARLPAIRDRLL